MPRLTIILTVVCLGGLTAGVSPVLAAFPGHNGKIAFDSDRQGGDVDIWTMNPNGRRLVNLTAGSKATDGAANWRADGRRIAFMSDRKTARNPDPPGSRGPDFEIFVMDADGSNPRQLTFNGLDDEDPAWSPDGSRIVYQRDLDPVRGETDYDLLTMSSDGTQEINLTNSPGVTDYQPNWSPDGATIAFSSDRNRDDGNRDVEIYKMSPDGSNVQQLTSNAFDDEFPNWSPNGRTIAFSSERNDNFDVYTVRAGGGSLKRLTRTAAGDGLPAFSPNGQRIAFFSERGRSGDVFTMRAGGRAQRNRNNNKAFEWAPDWQPTRRR